MRDYSKDLWSEYFYKESVEEDLIPFELVNNEAKVNLSNVEIKEILLNLKSFYSDEDYHEIDCFDEFWGMESLTFKSKVLLEEKESEYIKVYFYFFEKTFMEKI